jgi:hypothetical protein
VFLLNPSCECRALQTLSAVLRMVVMFALRGLRAAMFTEPAITQIEEVGRLVHRAEIYITSAQRLRLRQTHRHGHSPAVAINVHLNRIADLMLVEHSEQIV